MSINEQPYALVEIVWNDCTVSNGWTDASLALMEIKTAGYLVAEDDNAICVAGMVSDAGHCNAMVTIPKSCVVKRSPLAVALEDNVVAPTDAADGDGWIEWKSDRSNPPVSDCSRVKVRWSNGLEESGRAGSWFWHTDDGVSIIAYKVIKDS
jgi:hypothetical protein